MTDSVMCAEQPGLEVREGEMDHRQMCIGSLRVAIKHHRLVRVTQGGQLIVALPAIGAYHSALCHILLHESRERLGASIGHKAQSQSSCVDGSLGLHPISACWSWAYFDGSSDRRLRVDTTALALCAAAHKCLIYFDRIQGPNGVALGHPVALWPYHASAELVETLERCLVTPQPQLPLKLHRRLAGRLCRHKVSTPEPYRQRRVAILHDRASHERNIGLAGAAPQDDRPSLGKSVRLTDASALLTRKSMRPTQVFKISCTGCVIGKNLLKFRQCRWESAGVHARNLASNHHLGNQPDRQGWIYAAQWEQLESVSRSCGQVWRRKS